MEIGKCDKIIIGGAIGNCVHVASIFTYIQIVERLEYKTVYLGALDS